MYQAAIEGLLGLRRQGDVFSVDPAIPAMWPSFTIAWRVGETQYRIRVANPEHRGHGVASATLDGTSVDAMRLPIVRDGGTHDVEVVLGMAAAPSSSNSRLFVSRGQR
jgi:cellobiose phosphorylase